MSGHRENELRIAEGVTAQTLDDGRILVVSVATIQREAIDAFFVWIRERMETWDSNVPWLAIYDLAQPGAMLTPYMRAQAANLNDECQEVQGRVAMVMRRDTTGSLLSMFTLVRTLRSRQLRVWFNRDDALVWLRESL